MPRIRALKTYSSEFWDIIEGCAERHEDFQIETATITEALTMQGKFYSFRGALRREVEAAMLNPDKYPDRERNRIALAQAENTLCWVDRKNMPSSVRFCHKDESPTSVFLRKMIANKKQTPLPEITEQQLAESAQRLLKQQEEMGKGLPDILKPPPKRYG